MGAEKYILPSWETIPSHLATDHTFLGGKALGLVRLPEEWVPPFVVITRAFFELLGTQTALFTLQVIPKEQEQVLVDLLDMAKCSDSRILVRSNAPQEYRTEIRGLYRSFLKPPDLAEVAAGVDLVLCESKNEQVFAIVQLAVEPGLAGHMSNERRVSQRKSIWLAEDSANRFGQMRIRSAYPAELAALSAASEQEVVKSLRAVAGYLERLGGGFFHCEWVWSGKRLWVVQADTAEPPARNLPANRYVQSREEYRQDFAPESSRLTHFRLVDSSDWRKLERPILFQKIGLPTADVFLLTGRDWIGAGGVDDANLLSDLQRMCEYPVVVRCDVRQGATEGYTLLPTSPPSTDARLLMTFMQEAFQNKPVPDEDWAFLLARLVPARASVMVQAFPHSQRLRLDAIWGFPDGLLHFPHDSYFYHPAGGQLEKVISYKGLSLLCRDGAWEYSKVGAPDDWDEVLSQGEIEVLAEWGQRLANELGRQIQMMAFARIGGARGPEACLPWHYTDFDIPRFSASVRTLPLTKQLSIISSWADLEALPRKLSGSTAQAFLIRPQEKLRRNIAFLEAAGQLAAQQGKPLYFEGSLLGHAYYLLSKAGAPVVLVTEHEPSPPVTRYDKLVRDQIPTIIKRSGGLARVKTFTREEARTLLSHKLVEEAFEVLNSDPSRLADELADVLEVVDAMLEHNGIRLEDVTRIREAKRRSRGGFEKLIYLEETQPQMLDASVSEAPEPSLLTEDSYSPSSPDSMQQDANKLDVNQIIQGNDLFQIVLPLIPPLRGAAPVRTLRLKTDDYSFLVRYDRAQVMVTVRRLELASPANQLSLFDRSDEEG